MTLDSTLVDQIVAAVERRLRDDPHELADRPTVAGGIEVSDEMLTTSRVVTEWMCPSSVDWR